MKKNNLNFLVILVIGSFLFFSCSAKEKTTIWEVGKKDNSSEEFALAPSGYSDFIENNFGYEDEFFLINYSSEENDFPYVLPGPVDTWGGTWPTAGWRTHEVNILFGFDEQPADGDYRLTIELVDYAKKFLPLVKVRINDYSEKIQLEAEGYNLVKQRRPRLKEPHVDTISLQGNLENATPESIVIPISSDLLRKGGNVVSITVMEGSWIMFDQVRLEGPKTKLINPDKLFIRDVSPAKYELNQEGIRIQPLLLSIEHLESTSQIDVKLDGEKIFGEAVEHGKYIFEVPMPAVKNSMQSKYEIILNGKTIEKGNVNRSPEKLQTLADYVDTRIGTAHSRWMIAPGPWMPFSMVKMSPDNQNSGWQAGYQPSFESIGTFSHIHEWTLGGLGIFPTNGPLQIKVGDELKPDDGYRSRIDKNSEEAPIGYYKVQLTDYDIKAEITATTRCGMKRFTFPEDREIARVLVDLHIPTEYDYVLNEVQVKKVNDYRIEGFSHQYRERVWSTDASQDYTIHFVIEFDKPIINMGGWVNDKVINSNKIAAKDIRDAGVFVEFDSQEDPEVQVRSGISLVSLENADLNLKTEISDPFGWSFDKVRQNQVDVWNELFSRLLITSNNRLEKIRFYNAMYRSLCSRNTWSDVNGQWVSTDNVVRQLNSPDDVALGCDAFWNTFWNLNQLWNLATPEWSKRWVNSQLAMYDANGWLSKGPAGMNYIPVMVAEHEIPLMVGAHQMGIDGFDVDKVLEAAIKMQTTPAQKVHAGFAGNRNLTEYLKYQYVPYDLGRFSNTMEYSYDDWTVGQLAKSLGRDDIYERFNERGYWWKNAIDPETGFARMKDSEGNWYPDFDPFLSGANKQYVEGNAWQLTFFVPQDVPELIKTIGKDRFLERLDSGFKKSYPWRYNAKNDLYHFYPVVHGNQQSMHFAFLFNWGEKPWLTQKWSRSIIERYYGYGTANAYLGDEDQGQMSGWFVMAAIGLFQTDGGCRVDPVYEIASPLFERIEIDLGNRFGRGDKFIIEATNASRHNKYIQSARLNGKVLNSFKFPASELLKGGILKLEMGSEPNRTWGIEP
jgi:predicted alpha-1,2-mannosidase